MARWEGRGSTDMIQAPMDWTSGRAIAPTTSAQYPHPAKARGLTPPPDTDVGEMSLWRRLPGSAGLA